MGKRMNHGGNYQAAVDCFGLTTGVPLKLDFSVNLNLLGMPPSVERLLANGNFSLQDYPETGAETAVSALARAHGLPVEQVLIGNGSTELFLSILLGLKPEGAVLFSPCYSGYEEVCTVADLPVKRVMRLSADNNFAKKTSDTDLDKNDILFLCSPDNPTGRLTPRQEILTLAENNNSSWIAVDESFMDFVPDYRDYTLTGWELPENVIVVKSLTKFFSVAGLRLGLAVCHPLTAKKIRKAQLPWSVNALAQAVAPLVYADKVYPEKSRQETSAAREEMDRILSAIPGIELFPSSTNYLYARLHSPWNVSTLAAALLQRGIYIRTYLDGEHQNYIRLAVKKPAENRMLAEAIKDIYEGKSYESDRKVSSASHSLMVVGTTSDAGKSVLAAAFCRYLKRKNITVAPFKAQNMSLNSFVTADGGEMGRAQVVQARAAGIEPHVDMNPVLLKPTAGKGSQVILAGKPVGYHQPGDYYQKLDGYRKEAFAAYKRLASTYQAVVLEGAGGAAEINLEQGDFVNLNMAEYAEASVVLVADIELGGVFASLYGTIQLLPRRHRKLIKGFIINKFRGEKSLLDSGIVELERLTGIPVLGVLPFMEGLEIEEEDSVALKTRASTGSALLDIVVIRLPHISNYTDFQPLEQLEKVSLRYVKTPETLGNPDIIFIPGSKHVVNDLELLKAHGMDTCLKAAVNRGIPLMGICGGYQMLGERVSDPHGVEGEPGETKGLGLLPVETVLEEEKELSQVRARNCTLPFITPDVEFSGYEIHVGRTTAVNDESPLFEVVSRKGKDCLETAGYGRNDKPVFGTYIHGFFDDETVVNGLLKWLCERKGLDAEQVMQNSNRNRDLVYEKLADMLEENVAMDKVMGWLKFS
ncbi:MAG: cobyric acid synthase [Fibrobacteria bacterium]|nr:cobyric acid synthase [Fibrobacteria bacterium]